MVVVGKGGFEKFNNDRVFKSFEEFISFKENKDEFYRLVTDAGTFQSFNALITGEFTKTHGVYLGNHHLYPPAMTVISTNRNHPSRVNANIKYLISGTTA